MDEVFRLSSKLRPSPVRRVEVMLALEALANAVGYRSRGLTAVALMEKWLDWSRYGPKFTVTVLEQFSVPESHTLYMKLASPVVPVESSYDPSFGVVAIRTSSR
jgi:hypothetical protein